MFLKAASPSSLSPSLYFYHSHVSAGFPSPADDYAMTKLNLHEYVVKHPAATYFIRVASDIMSVKGIHKGDLLVVDRSLSPKKGDLVLAILEGRLEMAEVSCNKNQLQLLCPTGSKRYEAFSQNIIWGVITYVLHGF